MIAAIIGIILLTIALVVLTVPGFTSDSGTIPSDECGLITLAYVNNYLVAPGTTASLVSVTESKGLYAVNIVYQSQQVTLYTNRECSMLFTNYIDMLVPRTTSTQATPVKTDRPAVDLYVMSFCPYGTQAETVLYPVADLLGEKADITVRYITTVNGDTIESVNSMHGPAEVKENAFQLCVLRDNPDVFWEYLRIFNNQCYPDWQDSDALDACRKNVTATLMIDHETTAACASGADVIALLRADETDSDRFSAYSSPTLLVNGVKYSGARTPEAYKQFICDSFATAPEECSITLSSASAGSGGNC